MPEIKNNFTGGKMNKDLDERLIRPGEYRHAMNIQVSTSEGSHVGTIQNLLGNKSHLPDQFTMPSLARCVGSISDESNNALYWFVYSANKDLILEYTKQNGVKIVFCDTEKNVLKFQNLVDNNKLITGINIIDNMLFWTDNYSEPKKINIDDCKAGTNQNGNQHTRFINHHQGITLSSNILIEEKHITVIKKSPKSPITLQFDTGRDASKQYTGVMHITPDPLQENNVSSFIGDSLLIDNIYDFSSLKVGDIFYVLIESDIDGNQDFVLDWSLQAPDNMVVLKEFKGNGDAPNIPITDYRIRGRLLEWMDGAQNMTSFVGNTQAPAYDITAIQNNDWPTIASTVNTTDPSVGGDDGTAHVKIEITAIDGFPPAAIGSAEQKYAIDRWETTEKLFEFKFPRFSYRYKYKDGEYSTFAPWSEIAFVPGSFDHHPKKGYNIGMTNRLISITVQNFIPDDIPKDVIEVDILYKDEISPNIYVVETVKPNDHPLSTQSVNSWNANEFKITSDTIYAVLPSNQLLRPWDNVPKKALGQEVTGNRVVYANYWQNYNMFAQGTEMDYYPDFTSALVQFPTQPTNAVKSIKSLREYQLGVVFIDRYGRETPVITNPSGSFKLDKDYSNTFNRLQVSFNGNNWPATQPNSSSTDLEYLKFFIKETSGEYYNLAMDRYYDAEDGNVWLSFPSSDRNKIDIDTFLILKKGTNSDELVEEPARYKVLAIENSPPDYVATTRLRIETKTHAITGNTLTNIFGTNMSTAPGVGADYFEVNYEPFFLSSGGRLHEVNSSTSNLYVEFALKGEQEISNRYRVTEINCTWDGDITNIQTAKYCMKIDGTFSDDVNFITDDPSGINSTQILDTTQIRFYKYIIERRPQFDGRFFVKILNDDVFKKYIRKAFNDNLTEYKIVSAKKVYLLEDELHNPATNPTIDYIDFEPNPSADPIHLNFWNDHNGGTANSRTGGGAFAGLPRVLGWFNGAMQHFHAYLQGTSWKSDCGASHPFYSSFSSIVDPNDCAGKINHYEIYGWNQWNHDNGPDGDHEPEGQVTNTNPPPEVWFIDKGSFHGISPTNDLDFDMDTAGNGNQYAKGIIHMRGEDNGEFGVKGASYTAGVFDKKAGGRGAGLIESGQSYSMDLSLGGLYSSKWRPNSGSINLENINYEGFFQIGRQGGNDEMPYATEFAGKLVPGTKFRWKEDPAQTVYTIKSMSEKNRLRYNSIDQYMQFSDDDYSDSATSFIPFEAYAGVLSPANFTKTWALSSSPALQWNPVSNGVIPGGKSISLETVSGAMPAANINTSQIALKDNYFNLKTIVGTDSVNGGTAYLHAGMVLTSYNNGAVNVEFVVKDIEFDVITETYKVYIAGLYDEMSVSDFTSWTAVNNGQAVVFKQYGMNGFSDQYVNAYHIRRSDVASPMVNGIVPVKNHILAPIGYTIEILETIDPEEILPDDPAVWETEPKENTDLNIYYEASGYLPVKLHNAEAVKSMVPKGSIIIEGSNQYDVIDSDYTTAPFIKTFQDIVNIDTYTLAAPLNVKIKQPNGFEFTAKIYDAGGGYNSEAYIVPDLYNSEFLLNWYNCFSFGNGVESNRIRDNFNLPYITNGVIASTTLAEPYKEENRKYGLIFSGLYNSITGINNLNQFVAAENITKDINPEYGSIQKLHSRDTDLVTLCEDKILKILANKDAVFNADGNPQLVATQSVLGQVIPFVGEYGISKNPESFASEAYRAYFTDKTRGSVLRLSRDGLTPISDYGMRDWFKDNLKLGNISIIGSYDDKKDEYNLSIVTAESY